MSCVCVFGIHAQLSSHERAFSRAPAVPFDIISRDDRAGNERERERERKVLVQVNARMCVCVTVDSSWNLRQNTSSNSVGRARARDSDRKISPKLVAS